MKPNYLAIENPLGLAFDSSGSLRTIAPMPALPAGLAFVEFADLYLASGIRANGAAPAPIVTRALFQPAIVAAYPPALRQRRYVSPRQ